MRSAVGGLTALQSTKTGLLLLAASAGAQTPAETAEDEAVGQSLNYVFATDLGSGVYDLGGRTLQIYRFTYEKVLREVDDDRDAASFAHEVLHVPRAHLVCHPRALPRGEAADLQGALRRQRARADDDGRQAVCAHPQVSHQLPC